MKQVFERLSNYKCTFLHMLDFNLFEMLDSVTIARSGTHIQNKYKVTIKFDVV